jgi:NAD(P)-dependent dehydrogenase (short-subunit alcohol dehydrogenase family)
LEDSKGSIVCISSICGVEHIPGAPITYSVAKNALNAYIKFASFPLAKKGIKINGVVPGNINFPGSVWEKKLKENPREVKKMIKDSVPLNKLGSPLDIANLVTFLSSSENKFSTGSLFYSDGGQTRSI